MRANETPRPLSSLTKSALKKMVNADMTDSMIGAEYGVTRQAVHQCRARRGVLTRLARNEKRNEGIIAAYNRGMPGTAIAKKFGISVSQTYRVLHG